MLLIVFRFWSVAIDNDKDIGSLTFVLGPIFHFDIVPNVLIGHQFLLYINRIMLLF